MTHDFLSPAAQTEVTEAVRAVEKQAQIELVVAVRPLSGHYRHVDYLVGALAGLVALCVLLFSPMVFRLNTMPVDVLLCFLLGMAATSHSPGLRRVLSRRALQKSQVHAAAQAAFVEQGIGRTRRRNGLLVYVSLLEHRVELVADSGLDGVVAQAGYAAVSEELARSVARLDRSQFVAALKRLGTECAAQLPRVDAINELPDSPNI